MSNELDESYSSEEDSQSFSDGSGDLEYYQTKLGEDARIGKEKSSIRTDKEDERNEEAKINSRKEKIAKASSKIREDFLDYQNSAKKVREKLKNSKEDFATQENVLDNRTKLILMKFINTGLLKEINGCLSTGKEANVYHAIGSSGEELALKVYKTTVLEFRDRQRYIEGEFRYRRGFSKNNPRKFIALWAEKELRNLKRMQKAGVPCPEPVLVKQNVVLMKFIGENMVPAPKLKDARLSMEEWSEAYLQMILLMRQMYQECKLIHGDYSEYNTLYYKGQVYVIDVSQSIEYDHPYALAFLRRDIYNVNAFFKKQKVRVFCMEPIFGYIVSMKIEAEGKNEKEVLCEMIETSVLEGDFDPDEAIFAQANIPRTLAEIELETLEKDFEMGNKGKESEANGQEDKVQMKKYAVVTGLDIERSKGRKEENKKAKKEMKNNSDIGELLGRFKGEPNENDMPKSKMQKISAGKNQMISLNVIGYLEVPKETREEKGEEAEPKWENPPKEQNEGGEPEKEEESSEEEDESEEDSESGEEGGRVKNKEKEKKEGEDEVSKQERKKKVKEEKREKRAHKMKKKDKKQLMKKTQFKK